MVLAKNNFPIETPLKFIDNRKNSTMTPANWLTFGRLVVAPIVLFFFLFGDEKIKILGLVLFALGAISDFWDGYIARRTKTSYWGKLWDPIADKTLSGFALVALSMMKLLPWWITIALIFRDVIVTIIRIVKIQQGKGIIIPVFLAKLKTTFELIMLTALLSWAALISKPMSQTAEKIIVIYASIVVLLSWTTGIHYVRIAMSKKS